MAGREVTEEQRGVVLGELSAALCTLSYCQGFILEEGLAEAMSIVRSYVNRLALEC